ncbi:MAG: hypothetical protein IJZ61_03865 [Oscillospiraceae bacterium]|nr:hypothetical protein [Oscillospiraceae bacterium]
MPKIIIKDEHISDAISKGIPVTDILAQAYEGEIADRKSKDAKLQDFDAFQMSMMDHGISKHSKIKDFYATTENNWLFPVFLDRTLHENVNKNSLLHYLVSGSPITIPGKVVEGTYLDLVTDEGNKDAVKKKRVTEGADLPLATLKTGDVAITLSKYGRAVEATYESIQYCTIESFRRTIEFIADDVANQEFDMAVDVVINGDGNKNAAKVNTTASQTLEHNDLLTLAMDVYDACKSPMDVIIAPRNQFMALSNMMIATNGGVGIIPGSFFKFPQGINNDVIVIYNDSIPKAGGKEQLIGATSKYGLTKFIAEGSQIREYDSDIRAQKKLGTISETAGFQKPFKEFARVLRMA